MSSQHSHRARIYILAGITLSVATLVAYAAASGAHRYTETGDSYPGVVTAYGSVVGYFLATTTGVIVLGALVYIALTDRPGSDGFISAAVFRAHRLIEKLSPWWVISALVMSLITVSNSSGLSVSRVLRAGGALPSLVDASEQAIAWLVVAVIALVVAAIARVTLRWTTHVALIILTAVAVLAVPVAGNAGQGPNHDYATTAIIVMVIAMALSVGVRSVAAICGDDSELSDRPQVIRRVATLTATAEIVGLMYALVVIGVLTHFDNLGTSAFGRGQLGLIAALILMLATSITTLRGHAAQASAIGGVVAGLAAIAAWTITDTRTATALLSHRFTAWDVYLGYELPEKASIGALATQWRIDLFVGVGALLLAAGYLVGVTRVRRAGVYWSSWRVVSWLIGCATLFITSSSGVRAYGMAMFSVHMIEHMTLNMFIPVCLVLGAPITLCLRAIPTAKPDALPGPREWIVAMVHSPLSRLLTHPVSALIIFVGSLYGVYFTSLFDVLVRYHWGHELMTVHFVLTGYLFYWAIIGIDPGPRRLPYLARLGLLFAVMPFHAFFGIATMTMNAVIGDRFYSQLGLPWLNNLASDQFVGGAIAWGTSEAPVIVVVIALVGQWARSDRRDAARGDRHADTYDDDEMAAYNEMLAELAKTRR